jgi:hypothetical protein
MFKNDGGEREGGDRIEGEDDRRVRDNRGEIIR